jgi:hypothetical protein
MLYFYTSVFFKGEYTCMPYISVKYPVHLDLNLPSFYKLFLQTLFNNYFFCEVLNSYGS